MIRSPLLRGLVFATALALPLTGCPRKTEGGLLLKVTIESSVRADCLVVDATSAGARVSRSLVPRQSGKAEYFIGIARGDFPATLAWQASAYQGRCSEETEWKLASRSEEKSQTFPATGVTQFELAVGQPDATLDGDRDTFVDRQKGGTDCNDADAQVNPGASQVCGSTVDTNCNGRLFCDDPTCANEPACTRPATALTFDMPPATVVAADCSGPVALQSVTSGMPAAVAVDTTVTLAPTGSSATGLQLFADPACATPLTTSTLTLRFGVNRATFSFRAPAAGSLTLTASAMGLGSTAFTATITDRPVARLALNPVTLSAQAGACSTAVDVIAQDDRMMPTNVGATSLPLAVGYLPIGTSTVRTYTDATCATEGVPSIAAGTSTTRFYLRGTRATAPAMPITVQVSSPGVAMGMPATLAFSVTAGAPDHLEFVTSVLGLRNNECGTVPAEVDLFDVNGNLAVAGPVGVAVSLAVMPPGGGGTLQFFESAGCGGSPVTTFTVQPGQSRAGVYLRAMGPGSYRVSANASALPVPMASLQVDVATMDPTALVFPSSATTITTTAGACSPAVRLQTREMNALTSPVSPVRALTTVTVSPSAAGFVSLFSDPACATALASNQLTINAGSSEVSFYFRANRAAAFTLSASATNLTTTAPPQPAQVNPGPTSKLVFDPPTTVAATAGACGPPLVLRSFDGFDNPTSASGPITPAASPAVALPAGVAFSSAATCMPTAATVAMSDGGVTFFATAQRAQPYTLTATGISTSSTNNITFGVDAGAGSALRVVTQPMATLTAGGCTQVTIERMDAFMNPSPGAALTYAVAVNSAGVLSVHGDAAACMSGTPGMALGFLAGETRASFFVRGRLVGTSTLTVSAMSHSPATTAGVTVGAGPAEVLRFAMNQPPATSPVGACTTVTVQRLDGEGNLATTPAGQTVTATASGVGSMGGMLMAGGMACGSTAQMVAMLTFTGNASSTSLSYSPRVPGALNFVVSGTGLTSAMGSTTVAAGAVARVAFVNAPTTDQPWGGCTALELEALDVGNNRVGTPTMVTLGPVASGLFYAASDCMGAATASVTIPANSTITFGFRPQPAALGMTTVTATPPMPATAGNASVNVVAGNEAALQLTAFPMANTTAGTCVDFTVRRVDGGGNPTGGALRPVSVTVSGAASVAPNEAQLFTGAGCMGMALMNPGSVDIAAMASTATFSVRVRKAGALTLAAASMPLTAPANRSTMVVGGPLANLTFTTTPPASLAINTCSPAITVAGDDGFGNAAPVGTQTLSMTGASFSSVAGCGDSIIQLTAGAATSATFYLSNSTAGAAVPLTVGSAPSVMQSWNIVGGPATKLGVSGLGASVARFACVGPLSVRTLDASNNPSAISPARVIGLSASGTAFFFSNASCTTALASNQVTVANMASQSQDFYLAVVAPDGMTEVTVTATDTTGTGPLTAGTATATVTGAAGSLVLTPPTADVEFFDCDLVTVERRSNAGTAFSTGSTAVTVSLTSGTGLTLHSAADTACANGTATTQALTINTGGSSAQFRVRGRSAVPSNSTTPAAAVLTASDDASLYTSGTTNLNVLPLVRRGTCSLTDGATSVDCPLGIAIPVDRNRTFLISQAVSSGTGAPSSNVRCFLASTTTVTCDRAGSTGAVEVAWQTASWGRGYTGGGVTVQHFTGTASTAASQVNQAYTLPGSAGVANSFVLFSHSTGGATNENNGDDFLTGRLSSTSNVRLEATGNFAVPLTWAIQVVSMVNLTTVAAQVGASGGNTFSDTIASATQGQCAVIASFRPERPASEPNSDAICKRRVRAEITSDTDVTFTRAVGAGGNCTNADVANTRYERLFFPATLASVQETNLQLSGANAFAEGSLTAVALDRTIGFFSSQGPGGQAGGETDFASSDVVGHSQARLSFTNDTTVRFTRGATGSASSFTAYIVTFAQ